MKKNAPGKDKRSAAGGRKEGGRGKGEKENEKIFYLEEERALEINNNTIRKVVFDHL